MLLYTDNCFADHDTGQHPENAKRIIGVNKALLEEGWNERSTCPDWQPAALDELSRIHGDDYLARLKHWCDEGAGQIEDDTIVSAGTWLAATRGAGAAIDAVKRVVANEDKTAFCAIRPPGHHAIPTGPMGFCVINNVAVAARAAIDLGLERVLIIDWDVHHGNGTQDAFYDDGRIGFFSIHRSPFYPGTGDANETGTGRGLGWIANAPVGAGILKGQFFDAFDRGVEALAARVKPELILLSAGFDAHREDPVGGLCLDAEDFATLTTRVRQLADSYCNGKVVSLLEGGYHLDHLPKCVLQHVQALGS